MFPTSTRPATCPQSGTSCQCDICQPIHCPDCTQNFADDDAFQLHIRRPCSDGHRCGYCLLRFIRRLDLIEHYESGICRFRFNHPITAKRDLPLETTPLLPTTAEFVPAQPKFVATQQSWNSLTRRYKCYLCNPVKLGFHTLDCLNDHLADAEHQEKLYKCPHAACGLPFKTSEGLVQHIELRSCRCMTDSLWWNSYFIRPGAGLAGWTVTEFLAAAVCSELDLEVYWMRRYFEITGREGRWISRRDLFSDTGREIDHVGRQVQMTGKTMWRWLAMSASISISVLCALLPPILALASIVSLAAATFLLLQQVYLEIVALCQWLAPIIMQCPGLLVDGLVRLVAFLILLLFRIVELLVFVFYAIIEGISEFIVRVIEAVVKGL